MDRRERRRQEKAARRAGPGAPAQAPDPERRRKAAVNVFLASLLALFAIDALPASTGLHAWLQRAVDPLLDVTGLWQGNWNLFAPEPDKLNTAISAELTYADGAVRRWRSPDWRAQGVLGRARLFRHMEYYDGVRLGQNSPAWEALAQWLARTEAPRAYAGAALERVVLVRHTAVIPPPPPGLGLLDRIEPLRLPEASEPFHERWGPR